MRFSGTQTHCPEQAGARLFAAWIMAALALFPAAQVAPGGNPDSPAPPASAGSALYTLSDIYDALNNFSTTNKRAGAFTEPAGGPTNGAWTGVTLDQVYHAARTNATCSIIPKTGITTSFRAGDDGALRKGWPWPTPRFTVMDDTNCVLDNLTGLMWARNANLFGKVNWATAVANCNDLVYGGYDDWRLPNVMELISIIDMRYYDPALCNTAGTGKLVANDPFTGVDFAHNAAAYWTSTTSAANPLNAIYMDVANARPMLAAKTATYSVWPVRGERR